MTGIAFVVNRIGVTPGCAVLPPRGQPLRGEPHRLPLDVAEFYRLCGGVSLFEDAEFPMSIVGPDAFVKANSVIAFVDAPDDISDSWYIVARHGPQILSIDCAPARLGRCYDSFWDRHGVAGSCAIVAFSFTELLQRLLDNGGAHWEWLASGGHGDAYDAQLTPPA